MPKLVVNLAVVWCEAGTKESVLQTNNSATVTASSGLMTATENDFVVGANIGSFGTCRADPNKKPCKPVTPFPWECSVIRLPLLGQPAITDASQLTCVKFGKKKISVWNAGQITIEIAASDAKFICDEHGVPLGYYTEYKGITKIFDLNGTLIDIDEKPLEEDPLAEFVISTIATVGLSAAAQALKAGAAAALERGILRTATSGGRYSFKGRKALQHALRKRSLTPNLAAKKAYGRRLKARYTAPKNRVEIELKGKERAVDLDGKPHYSKSLNRPEPTPHMKHRKPAHKRGTPGYGKKPGWDNNSTRNVTWMDLFAIKKGLKNR